MGQNRTENILDVRSESAYLSRHRVGAVNIPLEGLTGRIHELPPREAPLTVYDLDRTRARRAASELLARGRHRVEIVSGPCWLAAGPTASGPSRDYLWQPHSLLVDAVDAARRLWGGIVNKTAVDIASGTGRDAVFLALAGFDVEAWDALPDALERCRATARRCRAAVRTHCRDVEAKITIPADRFDLICCFNFLHRPLIPEMAAGLRPGGLLVYETFVDPQRELFGKPRRAQRVLRPGELQTFFTGWEILVSREGLARPRRMVASLIARKPSAGS